MDPFARSALLIGQEGLERLRQARVALFGLGGVGGYVAEALARSGIGALDLFDHDRVSVTNLNRQIIATWETIGQLKTDAMAQRLRLIQPQMKITCHPLFYLPETAEAVDLSVYDYIVDAIDTVTAKLCLVQRSHALGVPIISAMGAGNRLDPTQLRLGDIFETQNCPLARVMRRELRKRGIPALRVAYSTEAALVPRPEEAAVLPKEDASAPRRDTPGSMAFVPAAMGLAIASAVTRDLIKEPEGKKG